MPEDFVTRGEYQEALNRMDSRISKIEQSTASIQASAETINNAVAEMHEVLYGKKQDGILFVIHGLATKMSGIQWVIMGIATSLMGAGATIIIKAL